MMSEMYSVGGPNRYSAKRVVKPISFTLMAPAAKSVSIIGDFNNWQPNSNPMKRAPDGGWHTQVPLGSGHHRYLFFIDGEPALDPCAQGTVQSEEDTPLSMIAIS